MSRALIVASLVWTVACASTAASQPALDQASRASQDRMERAVAARAAVIAPLTTKTVAR